MDEKNEMKRTSKVLAVKTKMMNRRKKIRTKIKKEDNDTSEKPVELVTIKEAKDLVKGLSEYQIRMMIKKKQIPFVQAGRKFFINKEVLMDYLYTGNFEYV